MHDGGLRGDVVQSVSEPSGARYRVRGGSRYWLEMNNATRRVNRTAVHAANLILSPLRYTLQTTPHSLSLSLRYSLSLSLWKPGLIMSRLASPSSAFLNSYSVIPQGVCKILL